MTKGAIRVTVEMEWNFLSGNQRCEGSRGAITKAAEVKRKTLPRKRSSNHSGPLLAEDLNRLKRIGVSGDVPDRKGGYSWTTEGTKIRLQTIKRPPT